MKRTGFARKTPPRLPRMRLLAGPNFRYAMVAENALGEPEPKHEYVRSEALMKAYRMIPCMCCGAVNQTVCGAHSNWAIHGKGKSIKADDNRCASMCSRCHGDIDQGSRLSEDERKNIWWDAHRATVALLAVLRRWPPGVPVPNLTEEFRP